MIGILSLGCSKAEPEAGLTGKARIEDEELIIEDNEITPDLFPETSRAMHDFNMQLIYILKPSLDEYKEQKISVIHTGVSNFLKNLQEPTFAANALLQLDFTSAFKTLGRFIINSTAGMFGVMDVAGAMGIKRDERDFGQTLGVWGVPMGGFFVAPVFAQKTTRDFAGLIVDTFFNPFNYVLGWATGLFIDVTTEVMSIYSNYDFIIATNETAIDSYTTFKTMYLQYRKKFTDEYSIFGSKDENIPESGTTSYGSYDYDFDMEF